MTRATMPGRNSTRTVWVDTTHHRCTLLEEDVAYPLNGFSKPQESRWPLLKFAGWISFCVACAALMVTCSK